MNRTGSAGVAVQSLQLSLPARTRATWPPYEYKAENFLGLLQLACAQILWRQL
jgi:hypothetical protein